MVLDAYLALVGAEQDLTFPTAATTQRLRNAQQAGQIADVDLEVAAELLYGPLYYRWLLRTGPISPEYVDAVVTTTLRALT